MSPEVQKMSPAEAIQRYKQLLTWRLSQPLVRVTCNRPRCASVGTYTRRRDANREYYCATCNDPVHVAAANAR